MTVAVLRGMPGDPGEAGEAGESGEVVRGSLGAQFQKPPCCRGKGVGVRHGAWNPKVHRIQFRGGRCKSEPIRTKRFQELDVGGQARHQPVDTGIDRVVILTDAVRDQRGCRLPEERRHLCVKGAREVQEFQGRHLSSP